jgi:integrase
MKDRGWSLFWRASKRCWVLKYRSVDGWAQKHLPAEIRRDEGPRPKRKGAGQMKLELEPSRAERWAAEWLANAEALKLRPKLRPGGITLREASETWQELRKDDGGLTSPATLKRFTGDFKNILKPFVDGRTERSLGDEDVVSLSTDFALIRRWFRAVVARHSPWRARSAFSTLRSFFDDARVEKWIRGDNPMGNEALVRELPDLPNKADRGGIVLFELDALQALIVHPHVPLGRATRYVLAATIGNREGELSGLTWGAIHLDASTPHVDVVQARRLVRAKDEVLGPLKTSTSRGVLPLHPAAVSALRQWRDDVDQGVALLLGRLPRPGDPVFPSERPQDKGAFSRPRSAEKLREDLVAADLGPTDGKGRNLTMHTCRKSFGTWLRRAKVPEPIRKALMRHGANDVTEDFYTENLPEMAEAVSRIPLKWAVVPRVVPTLVPTGTKRPPKRMRSLEPRVGIEPTTCALRKHARDLARGAQCEGEGAGDRLVPSADNSQKEDSGSAPGGRSSGGTKAPSRRRHPGERPPLLRGNAPGVARPREPIDIDGREVRAEEELSDVAVVYPLIVGGGSR